MLFTYHRKSLFWLKLMVLSFIFIIFSLLGIIAEEDLFSFSRIYKIIFFFYSSVFILSLASLSVRPLHYYDQIGLLKPTYVEENGYRFYDELMPRLQEMILRKFWEYHSKIPYFTHSNQSVIIS
ncbi:hypothetical protein SAMN02910293_00477 [Streptococcus henryi]|uniref:HTH merR-type domain-containing protein n=1 Tax=Streptococcus henryi TaxID=439219 RepID=A0A1G6ALM1_9STRE|nr:hypothetical protein SAMN02910293_00477 [Streptococcus henryi]